MSKNFELEKKISNLVNEFNSRNYEHVIKESKKIISEHNQIPLIHNLLGASYSLIDKHIEAIESYLNASNLDSNNEEIYRNLGKSYSKLNQDTEAYNAFQYALSIKSNNPDAILGLGLLKLKKNKFNESIEELNKVIKLNTNFYQAYYNIALAQNFLGNYLEAISNYLMAIKINNKYFQAYNNLGSILIKINQTDDAIKILKKAIEIKPDYLEALTNIGVAYLSKKKYLEALKFFNKAITINPNYVKAIAQKLYLMRKICDWSEDNLLEDNLKLINNSNVGITPWQLFSLDDSPKEQLLRAKTYGTQFGFRDFSESYQNSKIKIAYFTPDFFEHAGMINMEGIFKYHNKEKFEIYGFDYGFSNNDDTHHRIKKYFDKFFYVNDLTDEQISKLVKDNQIDIVIHRNGYSQNSRNTLFAKKMAPIQISFLGFPGTMGVDFIDYIVADKTVIPEENTKFFTEKIIYLPNTYYPTFNKRKISTKKYHRKDLGIDEQSFIFGSFNNSYKISSIEFKIWMKLLINVENSVLILLVDNKITKINLLNEINKFNIDYTRVRFLDFINIEDHLSRHKIIDLYLDTFNYNGHTSSVDALYAGIPVLTKIGKSFAARVCASILNSCDMSELITNDHSHYYDLAIKISKNKNILNELKFKLNNNLLNKPLFNTKKYVQNLEKGYSIAYNNKKNNKDYANIIV
ncbi:tetratricopeptide repeat protein [Alphaproteobacteria bacterium]|nr:tetratricopeptide repeat protein [Alphaproteobacteria bacterium]